MKIRALPAEWVWGVALGVLYVAAIVVMRHRSGLFTDELNHYLQIALYRHGRFQTIERALTTIPGYHALVAVIEWLFGADSLYAARLINAGFGLTAVAGFHALRRRAWPGTETLATAQFAALPILTPLLFLVYTDVLALALLLWATFATLTERHRWSAALLCGLLCVRQHEVVWAGFLAAMAAWPVWREHGLRGWRTISVRVLPYILPVAGFVAFWCWNGSISLSAKEAALHPDFSFHSGNLFFAAFLFGALLPLQTLSGLAGFVRRARRMSWLLALPPLLFAAFWWGFHVDNPYNKVFPWFYVRNAFLLAVDDLHWLRMFVGLVVVAATCGLMFTHLRPRRAAWLYPFATLFLAASWLIEQRYALIPFTLWLAFREQRARAVEYATLILWLVLAVYVFHGFTAGRFFL